MWWGGFLLCGLLLIIVSIPFFSFPKVLTREKEKIRLTEKAAAGSIPGTSSTNNTNTASKTTNAINSVSTKNDTAYGKDVKGKKCNNSV